MKDFLAKAIQDSIDLKKRFFSENEESIFRFYEQLKGLRQNKQKALIFGNGGSAADAQHFAAELMHRVENQSIGIAALALHCDTSLTTAIANDEKFETVYARQIEVLAQPGDVAIAISTSGNSTNILEALKIAKQKECRTVGLLGRSGGKAKDFCDLSFIVPHQSTPRIQEVHGMLIHLVCQLLEQGY
jgi:D-sedoheptulose 7-phosphate isomerase